MKLSYQSVTFCICRVDYEWITSAGITNIMATPIKVKLQSKPSNMSPNKRKPLTLEERVRVIERKKGGETAIAIAKSLNVGKTQIQCIIRDSDSILERWRNGERADSKVKRTKTPSSDLNSKFFLLVL